MSIEIESRIELVQYFGSASIPITDVDNFENIQLIYRISNGLYESWMSEAPSASSFSSFDPGYGYLIISKEPFSPYFLEDGNNLESLPPSITISSPLAIVRYFGEDLDLGTESHNYKQVFKIENGLYQSWTLGSPVNNFSKLISGETYLIVSSDSLTEQDYPYDFATISSGDRIYTIKRENNYVTILDSDTRSEIGTIEVQESPSDIVVDSVKNLAYIANSESYSVSVIDLSNNRVLYNIPLYSTFLFRPTSLVLDGQYLYAGSDYYNGVMVIDTNKNIVKEFVPTYTRTPKGSFSVVNGSLFFLRRDSYTLSKFEEKENDLSLTQKIISDISVPEFINLSSSSSDGMILAVKKSNNTLGVYKKNNNYYVPLSENISIDQSLSILFKMSGNGKSILVLSPSFDAISENSAIKGNFQTFSYSNKKWSINAGNVYGYESNPLTSIITNVSPDNYDYRMGTTGAINFDGSIIAIGFSSEAGANHKVGVYRLNNNSWNMIGSFLSIPNVSEANIFDIDMNDTGTRICVSSDENGGSIHVFDYEETSNSYALHSNINKQNLTGLGLSISVNATGSTILGTTTNGAAACFQYAGILGWRQMGQSIFDISLTSSNPSLVGSISSSGKTIILGDSRARSKMGFFGVYRFLNHSWHLVENTIRSYANEQLGSSVNVSKDGTVFNVSTKNNILYCYEYPHPEFSQSTTTSPPVVTSTTTTTSTTADPAP